MSHPRVFYDSDYKVFSDFWTVDHVEAGNQSHHPPLLLWAGERHVATIHNYQTWEWVK